MRSRLERLDPRLFATRRVESAWWDWLVNALAASSAWSPAVRASLLRRAGIDSRTTEIQPGCFFFSDKVEFGESGFVNHRCYFDTRDWIHVGDNVSLGMEVMLCTSTHKPGTPEQRAGTFWTDPIRIGDGCWIGTRATILSGVTVGAGCVVAAGAVVREDCEPHGLYAGVPARRIRDLD